jgi:hypothetical protein
MLYKRPNIYLSQHKPQGIRFWIAKHHELVSSRGLEKMQLISIRSVVDKLVVSDNEIFNTNRSSRERPHRPESFLIMLRNESTTPYTSFASSSKGSADVSGFEAVGVSCRESVCWFSFTATTTPLLDNSVLRGLLNPDDEVVSGFLSTLCDVKVGYIAWQTAGRTPPTFAGLGRLERCQS